MYVLIQNVNKQHSYVLYVLPNLIIKNVNINSLQSNNYKKNNYGKWITGQQDQIISISKKNSENMMILSN